MSKSLTKSATNRVIAGVCGGLGEYFDVDPILFRIGFLVMLFAGGGGFWLYILLALILPEPTKNASEAAPGQDLEARAQQWSAEVSKRNPWLRPTLGAIIIVIGLWLLLRNFGLVLPDITRFWPALLVVLGIVIIYRARK